MKIKLKNLGLLKQAEFEIGDLTILCGENNTGKTIGVNLSATKLESVIARWRFCQQTRDFCD